MDITKAQHYMTATDEDVRFEAAKFDAIMSLETFDVRDMFSAFLALMKAKGVSEQSAKFVIMQIKKHIMLPDIERQQAKAHGEWLVRLQEL